MWQRPKYRPTPFWTQSRRAWEHTPTITNINSTNLVILFLDPHF